MDIACEYVTAHADETSTMLLQRQIDELQQELSEHVEILEHIRSVSEPEAILAIRRLKSTPNASMVLSSLRGSAHTTARLSELKTARGVLPPTGYETDVELSMLHSLVYPVITPLDVESINIDSLFLSSTHRSPALMPLSMTQPAEGSSSIVPDVTILPPSPLRGTRMRRTSPVAGPSLDRQYCDARLNHLKIGYWTCIPISDEFAACVLSHYLETDHPMFACVDADLFLSALVDRTLEHCSPFLVCALMAFACVRLADIIMPTLYGSSNDSDSNLTHNSIRDHPLLVLRSSMKPSNIGRKNKARRL
jgi:hypothetical protein